MNQLRRLRPSPAMVVACIALTVALGGTSYATIKLPKNSIGAKQLKKSAVTRPKIKSNAVNGAKVADNALTGADVNEATLGIVPSATSASNAANADTLDSLDSTALLTQTLRAGETEVGSFSSTAPASGFGDATIVFRPRLPADIPVANAHRLASGSSSAACPGIGQAARGHLCAYEAFNNGMSSFHGFLDPQGGSFGVRSYGTVLLWGSAIDVGNVRGNWAVTAP